MTTDDRLEVFFSQSLDGFFFMMLDEPVRWDETVDKERTLDYVFDHQRVTKVNDAMLAQYGITREQFLGLTPQVLFRHDIAYGRKVWREFFDRGQLHVETDERRFDGTPIKVEGDYICFYDAERRITGHFGIQRDVTERKRAEELLRHYKDMHEKRADELESQNVYLKDEIRVERSFGDIVSVAPVMSPIFKAIEKVAATDSTVLVLGETGTGKELIARAIHMLSKRRESVMVKVNCGALPASLAESELFGYERGAFTGALQAKKGRFELAHRGTIFLDEVGELSPEIQVKLLRVLQDQELERLGATQTTKVDVRVIAATNRDLHQQVRQGAFRSDLFYRLNIFPIHVPPLRERAADVPLLARHFVGQFAARMGKRIDRIDSGALARLTSYCWPGNVRELANVLERAVILCEGRAISEEHLGALNVAASGAEAFLTLEEVERQHILRALERTGGVLAGPQGAARLLGMSRSTAWSRIRRLGIPQHARR